MFRTSLVLVTTLVLGSFAGGAEPAQEPDPRPNILWISCEDISPHLGCYGDPVAITPNLDRLASQGVRFTKAYTTCGVCATNRSSIITGMYPTSIGTQHMRCRARLPEHIKCFTQYLRDSGYYCTNNSKTDYNFPVPAEAWDENGSQADWSEHKKKPFFSVFNLTRSHESQVQLNKQAFAAATRRLTDKQRQDPARQVVPPYYPDTAAVRRELARLEELVTAVDYQVGELLKRLEDDGLADNTIVFFWSDHGDGFPRAKRWLYDSGTHVPLIVRIPKQYRIGQQGKPGTVDDQLVGFVDLAPTVLNLADVELPEHFAGRAFLGEELTAPREYVFGVRDRMDERYEIIRSVRDKRYRYVRNYTPRVPYYQYMNTAEKSPIMKELRRLHAEGKLPPQAEQFMAAFKPIEELYDVDADPYEVQNLAASPRTEHQEALRRLRLQHVKWTAKTQDLGLIAEPELVAGEKQYGSRWAIAHQKGAEDLIRRLQQVAVLSELGTDAIAKLSEALDDPQPAIRYWGAVGLGNLGPQAVESADKLKTACQDNSASVRVAAAEALYRMGEVKAALGVLCAELKNENPWVRLAAAIALDQLDADQADTIAALQAARAADRKSGGNKYVVRVTNRALNEVLGENTSVP